MLVQQLPIYNKTRRFVEEYITQYEKIRNLHKHRIGAYCYDKAVSLAWYIKKANRAYGDNETRVSYIEDFLDGLECVKNAIRIMQDCRIIDFKAHARLSEYIVDLSKQATAWKGKLASIS